MSRFHIVFVMFLLSETLRAAAPSSAARPDAIQTALAGPSYRTYEGGVDRPGERELPAELVKKTIHKYVEGEWGRRVKEVQVTVLEPSNPVKVPPGIMDLRVLPGSNEEGLGRRMFQMAVTVNGKPWKTIEVLADVAAMIDAVVPNRSFRSDEIVDAPDVKTVRIRILQLFHPFITDREEVIGKSAARPLPADIPLRAAFLKTPVMVKKGDRVMIEAKRGGLSIQTYGVTKASGHVGQTVMVGNLDSGRELRAKIVAPGLVQVEF